MPLKENRVADPEGKRMRCWRCDGLPWAERVIDMHTGVSILQYACFNCGRRWHSGDTPRPVVAAKLRPDGQRRSRGI
jgi:hypothetical protein